MLLALDIGNSTIVAVLFDGGQRRAEEIAASTVQRSPEEAWDMVRSLLGQTNGPAADIQGVAISSVVPFLTDLFSSLARTKLAIEPLVINGSLNLGIVIHYTDPASLGSDRICSAIAAYAKYGGPSIVIDFGTATTYGVIGANGDFLGGAISLGVKSTAEALHRRAAQLPGVELYTPGNVIATNTPDAINAGTMFGAIDAVEGIVKRIQKELGTRAKVIATGGLSAMMAQQLPIIDACDPSLVLEGVRLIYKRLRAG